MKVFLPKGVHLTEHEISVWGEHVSKCSEKFELINSTPRGQFDIDLLNNLKRLFQCHPYATQMWQEHLEVIARELMCQNKQLLQVDMVKYAIYLSVAGYYARTQLPYLKKNFSESLLKYYLYENNALQQTIIDEEFQTSESRINHLTHLCVFEISTGIKIQSLDSIVEFGGGYGGMTLLMRRMNQRATIIVIDFPEMITLQKYYIDSILGVGHTNVKLSISDRIIKGLINYICIGDLKNLTLEDVSLLVATWSLSEANFETQKLLANKDLFNSSHLLYGYRKYETLNSRQPCSTPMEEMFENPRAKDFPAFWATANEQFYFLY